MTTVKSFPRCLIWDIQRVSHHLLSSSYHVQALRVKSCSQPKHQVRLLYSTRHIPAARPQETMENIMHYNIGAFFTCCTMAMYSCANVRGSSSCSQSSPSLSPALNYPFCCVKAMVLGLRVKSQPAHSLHNWGAPELVSYGVRNEWLEETRKQLWGKRLFIQLYPENLKVI